MRPSTPHKLSISPLWRIRLWYGLLLLVVVIFIIRLFYLQVIRHDYYQQAALRSQLKQYEIEPTRGTILAHNGGETTPLVLNQTLYTVYADPKFITDSEKTALAVQRVLGGDASAYEKQMKHEGSRYEILAKKQPKDKRDAIVALKLKGVGAQEMNYRTYPQGQLASQILGFVNDEGDGQYGLEQALNAELKGTAGKLKAITDAQGVPLAANKDNTIVEPIAGKQVLLTIDLGLQQQVEDILKQRMEDTRSNLASGIVIEVKTGAIKAMANYPTYNPAEFYKVTDQSVFNNAAVTDAFEVGSIMKVLTTAAGIDKGVFNKESTYYDPGGYRIDDAVVKNVEGENGVGTRSVRDILQQSLNTGATWELMQLGGGDINQKARTTWHDYLVNRYLFGKVTGIEQSNESAGSVPDPNDGFGLDIQYANTAFGQGQSETLIQMGSALAAVINGGTYYQPHLIDAVVNPDGSLTKQQPKVVKEGVVKASVSKDIQELMQYVVERNRIGYGNQVLRPEYIYGGKTGTAQIAKPGGGYYDDRFTGTFMGFVGGNEPEYVIIVRLREPHISGYAGAQAAAPTFFRIADVMINNYGVKPKS